MTELAQFAGSILVHSECAVLPRHVYRWTVRLLVGGVASQRFDSVKSAVRFMASASTHIMVGILK